MARVVIVTGAAGFLGGYIAAKFANDGWAVVGVGQGSSETTGTLLANYEVLLPSQSFGSIVAAHRPSLCIHCAGGASVGASLDDPAADYRAGPLVAFEVLDTLRRLAPDCATVLLSSAAVYGNPPTLPISEAMQPSPISPYGFHKLQCEMLCREFSVVYGMRTGIARIFSAYGPGLRKQVLWDICRKATQGEVMLQGTGRESRDFVHASDVANAVGAIAGSAELRGEAYNVASGRETTIGETAAMLLAALGSRSALSFDGIEPRGVPLNWRADVSRLHDLGLRAGTSLEAGLRDYAAWFRGACGS